ncbi:PTS N-acetylglucosamine transporter subunit IIABC [Lactobacillus pentosus] [Lactiplantibacillus mudanjiangensis]|uniref:PTS N-acetylglucosamine transporter subunit IIABC [Lactobacillus pentosus] n=1 Tax=Lactiplantibacillus mudanjiangensis TaxID=1296538 RepID=A0A660E5P2_9LACO|nr:PTS N-acetylglucosamine transporter subunit IIABC [Lactobacillus pentosus] [Lactiplantibacillus mudanjiangensis]VDG27542.1 PTS N-acetylglucosamine transporter subunit IIABC [Lactobacillus pentosus] [Lactiplantibacillus mudanjiangensis]
MKTYFQRMGQSLMLPIATLPAAAILVGIGNYLPKGWIFANLFNSRWRCGFKPFGFVVCCWASYWDGQ